jgi:hypothetical protein
MDKGRQGPKRNDDGFVTAEEVVRCLKEPFELKFKNAHANYSGTIEESADEVYGKKSYKIQVFTTVLELSTVDKT